MVYDMKRLWKIRRKGMNTWLRMAMGIQPGWVGTRSFADHFEKGTLRFQTTKEILKDCGEKYELVEYKPRTSK